LVISRCETRSASHGISRLIPKQAAAALREKGIDLDEIIRPSTIPDARGTLLEVEDHKKNERVVVALE
jgi:hypothetical protein